MVSKFSLSTGGIDSAKDYQLIGISSPLKEHRLAVFINRTLNFNLRRLKDLTTSQKSGASTSPFPLYSYDLGENQSTYYLLSNKNKVSKLVPSLKSIDYFLLIKNKLTETSVSKLIKNLTSISAIQTAFEFDQKIVKDMTFIFNDLEIHEISM